MASRPVDDLGPQAQEAVAHLVLRIRQGFTGSFVVELKDGVPQLARSTETVRFRGKRATALDRGGGR